MSALTKSVFWADTAERAVKTFAQTLVALLGAGAVDILHIDWGQRLSVSAGAMLVSVLTSIASAGSGNSASLVVDNVKE
jgi:hypothetical protein